MAGDRLLHDAHVQQGLHRGQRRALQLARHEHKKQLRRMLEKGTYEVTDKWGQGYKRCPHKKMFISKQKCSFRFFVTTHSSKLGITRFFCAKKTQNFAEWFILFCSM